jgi:hypothetical protein
MRRGSAASRMAVVTNRPIRLALELDSVDEPISGRTLQDDGSSRPFVGWLGLAVALRSAFGSHPRVPATQARTTGSTDGPGMAP